MTDKPYTVKKRPNLFDLALMDGVLNGGGYSPPVTREAYWPQNDIKNEEEAFDIMFFNQKERE